MNFMFYELPRLKHYLGHGQFWVSNLNNFLSLILKLCTMVNSPSWVQTCVDYSQWLAADLG